MELLENNAYSTEQMIEFFNVSKNMWKKKKGELLKYLGNFYEYEIQKDEMDRRKNRYVIIKKYKDYEPKKTKSEIKDEIYRRNIIKIIEVNPIQTAKNVSRIMMENKEIISLKHKEGTVYQYVRIRMKDMFGTKVGESGNNGGIVQKVWCRLDDKNNLYIKLNEDELDNFFGLFDRGQEKEIEKQGALYSDYKNDLITEEEFKKLKKEYSLQRFLNAKKIFNSKYGFYPIKVSIYELGFINFREENKYE